MSSSDVSKLNDSSSETDGRGLQLVYLKDNVAIHPTRYASERITGRLKLIKQGNSLFMVYFYCFVCICNWLAYKIVLYF